MLRQLQPGAATTHKRKPTLASPSRDHVFILEIIVDQGNVGVRGKFHLLESCITVAAFCSADLQMSVRISLKGVVQQIISEKKVGWVGRGSGGGGGYGSGVTEGSSSSTAADAGMCENKPFLKDPVGLFATFLVKSKFVPWEGC